MQLNLILITSLWFLVTEKSLTCSTCMEAQPMYSSLGMTKQISSLSFMLSISMQTDFILSYECACPLPNTPVCSWPQTSILFRMARSRKDPYLIPPPQKMFVLSEGKGVRKSLDLLHSFPLWGSMDIFQNDPMSKHKHQNNSLPFPRKSCISPIHSIDTKEYK